MNKSELISKLTAGLVKISFTKVNGETRLMHATLDKKRIQYSNTSDIVNVQRSPVGTQAVWDNDAPGWRSFRLSSVISVDDVPVNGIDLDMPS